MIKKYLTCKTYLRRCGEERIVARLNTDCWSEKNELHVEVGDTATDWYGKSYQTSPNRYYLSGEVANRLYEYEQLGYTPEELKEIIKRDSPRRVYITTGRMNGKSFYQRDMTDAIVDAILSERPSIPKDPDAWKLPYKVPEKSTVLAGTWSFGDSVHHVSDPFEIDRVIFNDPATIVLWKDGTKTVVKAENEAFDPEKGLAMAITKKALGNKGSYFETIKKWIPKKEESVKDSDPSKPIRRSGKYPWGVTTYREKSNCDLIPNHSNCGKCWDTVIKDKAED